MSKIFLTGATGLIGGEVLYRLASQSASRYQIACLVRDQAKASAVSKAFPDVRIVQGDLDNTDLIETEAKRADVVLHLASTKHAPSSKAIATGLGASGRNGPGYWIQMSGASLFSGPDMKANTYGKAGGKVYDDLADRDEIWSIVQQTPTRVVEQLVLSQDPEKVKTALLVGPIIYGTGRGPSNTVSIQSPTLAQYALKHGKAWQVGKGQSVWSTIHVRDLSSLVLALVKAASTGESGIWNKDGIYCPENGSMAFGELAALISKTAKEQGFTSSEGVESFDAEKSNQIMGHGAVLLGTNAKQRSSRARERLGWSPSEPSLADTLPEMVKLEAAKL